MPPTTTAEAKAALRRVLAALPPADWTPLKGRFLALPEVEAAQTVLLFYGVGREPDTRPLILALLERGKRVALPRCLPGNRLEARAVSGLDELRPGPFRIPEPAEGCPLVARDAIDLILVPNLCCDKRGRRLGHGGGYYDRYLEGFQGFTVALCPASWLQEELPAEAFDVPVDLVLTETRRWRGAKPRAAAQEEPAAK